MDGRIQESLIRYLKETYGAKYVDSITEPGPCKILAEQEDTLCIDSIYKRLNISVNHHKSRLIAISGHYDCAGNPVGEAEQRAQVKTSIEYIKSIYNDCDVIGLWIDENWKVHTV